MNNVFRFLSLLCAITLTLVSCQKETQTLKVVMESPVELGGKVYLDAQYYPHWDAKDTIVINGAVYEIKSGGTATVTTADSYTSAAPVDQTAKNICNNGVAAISVPRISYYSKKNGNQRINAPMMGYTTGNTLQMKNLASLVRFGVTYPNNATLHAIEISDNNQVLSGRYTYSIDNNDNITKSNPNALAKNVALHGINLSIGNSSTTYCMLAILPVTNAQLTIKVYVVDGSNLKCYSRTMQSANFSVAANEVINIPIDLSSGWTLLTTTQIQNNLFTVNVRGDQVKFSKSNLRFRPADGTYGFFEHQYDYLGQDNNNIASTYNGWIDLFGYRGGANRVNWISIDSNKYYYDFANNKDDFEDWGVMVDHEAADSAYRCLKNDEWKYIMLYRNAPPFVRATILNAINGTQNVCGVILFPDGFVNTTSITFNTTNQYSKNQLTTTQWSQLETLGCVFLPAAGYRKATTFYYDNNNPSSRYWSSTHSSKETASFMSFTNSDCRFDNDNRYIGRSVRLVQGVVSNTTKRK